MKLLRASLELGLLLGLLDACLVRVMSPVTLGDFGDVALMLSLSSTVYALTVSMALAVISRGCELFLRGSSERAQREVAVTLASVSVVSLVCVAVIKDMKGRGLVHLDLLSGLLLTVAVAASVGVAIYGLARLRGAGHLSVSRSCSLALLLALCAFPMKLKGGVENVSGKKNIVLISIDTLRADHLGVYGYDRDTSPNIDELAKDAVVFEEAFSSSHWTFPSHASLLTGLDPVALGALGTGDTLQPEYKTLAETLKENGWQTAAFVGGGNYSYISSERGFGQGFNHYVHAPYSHDGMQSLVLSWISHRWSRDVEHEVGTATSQMAHVQRWLKTRSDAPFFLFLHLYDVHSDKDELPYDAPGEFRERFASGIGEDFTGCHPSGLCASEMLIAYARGEIEGRPSEDHIERMIELYDGGIAYADAELSRFFDMLERAGISESTTLVITSDHGEAFFEHGLPLHEDLHHENLHVPLILKDSDLEPGRVRGAVQNMDIVPTILELVGVGGHKRSALQALLAGEMQSEAATAYSVSTKEVALTTHGDKLIVPWDGVAVESAEVMVGVRYQRESDLRESEALPAIDAEAIVESLLEATDKSADIREAVVPTGERSQHETSEAHRLELRALGYVD